MFRPRYRKEMKELGAMEQLLRQAESPSVRAEAVRETTLKLNRMKKETDAKRNRNNSAFRIKCLAHTGREPRDKGRPCQDHHHGSAIRRGGQAVLGMEVIFAGAIGRTTFALSAPSAIALGVMFMLSMTLTIKAILAVVEELPGMTPSRALARFLRIVLPLSIVWLVAIYVLLTFGRLQGESVDDITSSLVPICLGLLTAISPAVGALLLSIARLADWAQPFVEEADALEHLDSEIDLVLGLLPEPPTTPGADMNPPPRTPRPGSSEHGLEYGGASEGINGSAVGTVNGSGINQRVEAPETSHT